MEKLPKKVLVIYGSPRVEGNTDILLKEIIRGIRDYNPKIKIKEVYLRNMDILPCQECRACDRSGKCVIEDDMQKLYLRFSEAEYIILGSPIFFYTVTAWTKAMIDRCQALWAKKYLLKQPIRDKEKMQRGGWFVSVGATRGKKLFDGTLLTVRYFFDALNVAYRGDLLFPGVDEKGEVLNHPEFLSSAYNLGRKIASL